MDIHCDVTTGDVAHGHGILAVMRPWMVLTKARLMLMVLVTTTLGYYLANVAEASLARLLWTLLGTALAGCGAGALNQYLERDADARMKRTARRPLVTGELAPLSALLFGVLGVLSGVIVLVEWVNLAAAFVVLLTAFLYVLVYTPMKRYSWLNTSVGAIPGALPPVVGWAAAAGDAHAAGAWFLFALMWAWQHPHFYALAWLYREDYARGGFSMISAGSDGARRTSRGVLVSLVVLLAISLSPAWTGVAGRAYLMVAAFLGVAFVVASARLIRSPTLEASRLAFGASLLYLPVLLLTLAINRFA